MEGLETEQDQVAAGAELVGAQGSAAAGVDGGDDLRGGGPGDAVDRDGQVLVQEVHPDHGAGAPVGEGRPPGGEVLAGDQLLDAAGREQFGAEGVGQALGRAARVPRGEEAVAESEAGRDGAAHPDRREPGGGQGVDGEGGGPAEGEDVGAQEPFGQAA